MAGSRVSIDGIERAGESGIVLNAIARIERFTGQWEVSHTQPSALIERLRKTTVVTSTGASTRIEGSLLSDAEVAKLLSEGCKITKISSRSEREVAGYIKVMEYIYEHFPSLEVSEHTLKALHQLMTSDFTDEMLAPNQRGEYKNIRNDVIETDEATGEQRVWFATTPPGPQTQTSMHALISGYHELLEKSVPTLLVVAWFVVQFLAIHPFRDGNGRLSRLITTWLLLRHGYTWSEYVSHEKFIEDTKEHYYVALRNTQATLSSNMPSYQDWFDFFMNILMRQISFLEQTLPKDSHQQQNISAQLSKNEKKVYELLLKEGEMGISAIENKVGMSTDGLKKLLKRLVDKGIIQRLYQGRATKYKA